MLVRFSNGRSFSNSRKSEILLSKKGKGTKRRFLVINYLLYVLRDDFSEYKIISRENFIIALPEMYKSVKAGRTLSPSRLEILFLFKLMHLRVVHTSRPETSFKRFEFLMEKIVLKGKVCSTFIHLSCLSLSFMFNTISISNQVTK